MNAILLNVIYFGLLIAITKPLGLYMYRFFSGMPTPLTRIVQPLERGIYRIARVNEEQEMRWTTYSVAMLLFSGVGMLFTYLILRLQHALPLNPMDLPAVEQRLSFNTAASFTTNTNWQSYVPEATMSYLSNMTGLATHNFMSAATGIALAIALVRGFARRSAGKIGNLWVDIVRVTLYLLLPVCFVVAIVLVSRGVPQNF